MPRLPAALAILIVCALSASVAPLPVSAATAPDAVKLSYTTFKLDNGLEVIFHEDHRLPLVAVNLWYHVGPAQETAGKTGFAHLFEHMMFEGSKHVPSTAHFQLLERAGASDINGTTDFDRTNYFETLPANQLELALWLESDRMGYLLDGLDAKKLTNQRDVVRNERRQSVEGEPYGLVEEEVFHQLFPANHPYHASVIGSHADIEAARLADVREFSRTYYTPNNASLAIAGDIDPVAARALVEKYFGSIPAGPKVPAVTAITAPITAERRAVVTDKVPLARVYMAWITAPIYQPGDAEADIAAQLLGGSRSARLYKRLVRELEIAQDVAVQNQNLQLGSVFTIQVTAKPGVTPARIEREVDLELAKLSREGPAEAEVARARTTLLTHQIAQLERLGGFGGVADTLNRYNQFLHDPGYLDRDLKRFEAVTPATVKDTVARTLVPSARVVVEGVPGEKVIQDVPRAADAAQDSTVAVAGRMPEESWRANPPKPAERHAISLPVTSRFRLDNGLTVLVSELHTLPVVTAALIAPAGTSANPVNRPGLASFTAEMLEEGSTTRSADQLADAAATLGSEVHARAGRESAAVSIRVLATNAGPALDLLADVVEHPRFAPADVERVRRLRDGDIRQSLSDPATIARNVSQLALYGSNQAFGYPDLGTQAANAKLTTADIRALWQARYLPGSSALVLAGDVTPAEARRLAEAHFGNWHGASSTLASTPAPRFVPEPAVYLVDRPGAPQSALEITAAGPPRSTPDFVPLEVTNNVLGGLFSSRINMNLREAHGYTYGAGSSFQYARTSGAFAVGTLVRTDATAPAIEETLKELARIRTEPPSDDEMRLAKGAFAESLAGLFETSQSTALALRELYLNDLPDDYFASLGPATEKVTAADVTAMATRHLMLKDRKIVVVGDRAKVGASIAKLGLGPINLVDAQGQPATKKAGPRAGAPTQPGSKP